MKYLKMAEALAREAAIGRDRGWQWLERTALELANGWKDRGDVHAKTHHPRRPARRRRGTVPAGGG